MNVLLIEFDCRLMVLEILANYLLNALAILCKLVNVILLSITAETEFKDFQMVLKVLSFWMPFKNLFDTFSRSLILV